MAIRRRQALKLSRPQDRPLQQNHLPDNLCNYKHYLLVSCAALKSKHRIDCIKRLEIVRNYDRQWHQERAAIYVWRSYTGNWFRRHVEAATCIGTRILTRSRHTDIFAVAVTVLFALIKWYPSSHQVVLHLFFDAILSLWSLPDPSAIINLFCPSLSH